VFFGTWGAIAQGIEYHFVPTEGVWGSINNWLPNTGPPGAGDTAIIGADKTCKVSTANQTAETVQVAANGTLEIKGRTLSIEYDSNPPSLTVNGTVQFIKPAGGAPPALAYAGDPTDPPYTPAVIDGSGLLHADGEANAGQIRPTVANGEDILEIRSGVTLKGSLTIKCENVEVGMKLDGTFVVDDADDDMLIAGRPPRTRISRVATLEMRV
jgi:hypothetical protein